MTENTKETEEVETKNKKEESTKLFSAEEELFSAEEKEEEEEDVWQGDVETEEFVPDNEEWKNYWIVRQKTKTSLVVLLQRIVSYKPTHTKPFIIAESTSDANPRTGLSELWKGLFQIYTAKTPATLFKYGLAAQVAFPRSGTVFLIIQSEVPGISIEMFKQRCMVAATMFSL